MDSHPEIAVSSGHSEEFESDPRQPVSTRRVPLASDAIHRYLKRRSPFNHMAVMFCKSAVLAAGNYQSIPYFEDYDLWVRNGSKEVSRCQFSRYARVCPYRKRYDRVVLPSRTFLLRRARESGFLSFSEFLIVLAVRTSVRLLPKPGFALVYKTVRMPPTRLVERICEGG